MSKLTDDGPKVVRTEQTWEPEQATRLNAFLRRKNLKSATFMKAAAIKVMDEEERAPSRAFDPVPVLGVIAAGAAIDVIQFDDVFITPPYELEAGSYVLLVAGDSMESDEGLSIESGSYAVFNKDAPAPYSVPVHVEWEDSPGDRVCTLKRYCPSGDSVEFRPLNEAHEPITRKRDTFEIRGVFMDSWMR